MKTIYRDNSERLSVADAKRLILEALPHERSAEVYARVDENGKIDFDGPVEIKEVHGVQIYASFIDRDFLSLCQQLNIQPRMKYRPAFTDYTWQSTENDTIYTIGHDEFSRLTELFGLTVAVGPATEPQTAPATDTATTAPAPVVAADLLDTMERTHVKRKTWRDVAWTYVVETFKGGQYSTAKNFYRALENKAGANDSPFDKGTGMHLHSLYVREICETVTLKTIQNAWAEIKTSQHTH